MVIEDPAYYLYDPVGSAINDWFYLLVDAPVHHTIELVNTVKDMHNNRKEKKKQTIQTAQTTQTTQTAQTTTPQFQIDKEAMDWIFSEADQNAKALKNQFKSIVRSDLPAETKYSAYSYFFKKAHEYMQR